LGKEKDADGAPQPYCPACKKILKPNTTAIRRHGVSKAHVEKSKSHSNSTSRSLDIRDIWCSESLKDIAGIEIKLSMFIAENNLPLSLSDRMTELLRDLFPDNMEKVRLGKQKCTNIIRQVLGFNIIKENVQFLRDHKFSIFVDETTDRATKTQCAIVAMAFDPEQLIINIILLDLIELEDERAVTIAAEIARVLEDRKIQN
jgi:hypothetical protein